MTLAQGKHRSWVLLGLSVPSPALLIGLFCALFWLTQPVQARETTLIGGWSEFPPYSYLTTTNGVSRWEGFDVELLNAISDRADTIIISEETSWSDHVEGIASGDIQIAPHATLTAERQAFATFSIPYRTETMVLVMRTDDTRLAGITDVDALISGFRDQRFRVGTEEGVELPSFPMRGFIANPEYENAIFRMRAFELVEALLNDEIDGFWADRVEAAHLNEALGVTELVSEHAVQLTGNLHLMFSKESVPWDVVVRFNAAIESVQQDGTYQRLNTKYSFPILVTLSLDNFWFKAVDIVGTVAFALSGLILAYRYNYDLFGAFVLAALPAAGGGILRDLISNRGEIAFFNDPLYISLILGLVLVGYGGMRIFQLLPHGTHSALRTSPVARNMHIAVHGVQLCDAIGLAAFTVTGVVVALVTHATPLWIWGPILAAITAAGGGILRDITRSDPDIPFLKGELYPEIAAVWGLFLSFFLLWEARLLEPNHITIGIAVTFAGVLVTRLLVIWLGIKSPVFAGRSQV